PFRLPTEAEWEKATRGGLEQKDYPWGDLAPSALALPGYDAKNDGPLAVGMGDVNDYGLCDMSGGVHEWCSDWYKANYYAESPEKNPQGASAGKRRASRGGSWRHRVKFSRCAARSSLDPSLRYADYGFRVAMSAGGEER
ncbi:MAG: formylglycine-generating enzyme family protein, partial [Deltaproteobacteria bacterium]|nr:formylglycine-generating enzyme family protein [Deltaproteobacteria bacterium]